MMMNDGEQFTRLGGALRNLMLIASNTLLITDLSLHHFSTESIDNFKTTLSSFGELKYLVPFKALSRLVVVFSSTISAIAAKEALMNYNVYFGQETELSAQVDYLKVPEVEKNFLLSPPGSPPVDWVQSRESGPSKAGHTALLKDMDHLDLDDTMDLNNSNTSLENKDSSRIVLTFSNPLPSLCDCSSSASLPMIIVDNYDGEELNENNWMGGGMLKSKKGAVFHQTRMPDYN